MPDHVHMMISIPPKYAVSQVIGYIKGRARSIWRGSTDRGRAILQASTLGARIVRVDGGERGNRRARVYPEPGARGQAIGSNGSLVAATVRWLRKGGVALAAPNSRFERLTNFRGQVNSKLRLSGNIGERYEHDGQGAKSRPAVV